jgi:hypothetical protein
VTDTDNIATLYQQTARSAATVLDYLAEIETMIGELQSRIGELPFFARGFVSLQVTKGTGQDIPVWGKTIAALTTTLRQVREAAGRDEGASGAPSGDDRGLYSAARTRVDGDRPRLERLAAFMESVPSKLGAIPPGLLPADQRADFLATVARQTAALRGAITEMPALSAKLSAISDQPSA